jgi:hypothetical protein
MNPAVTLSNPKIGISLNFHGYTQNQDEITKNAATAVQSLRQSILNLELINVNISLQDS